MSDQFSILTGELERPAFVNGSTPRARRASETGAIAAQQDRPTKLARVRKAWRQPHTLQDVAAITNLPVSSVCSLKACLADEPRGSRCGREVLARWPDHAPHPLADRAEGGEVTTWRG